ncbi:MAG: hypothetical protein AUH25_03290 [Thaumarchaeota archaeon 13_1_40CM_38_12]|nr:MAG: hypothetical protein AUH25_03290 [Thaumarchaeota archaeon 13_1_40CM_38_12]OLD41378.1 MAG: hypothetical protein AUI60_01810 [Thaumarchaeota archaeon 13_1_40CM_2_39_4]
MLDSRVVIVIVNWNGFKDTVECIESLMKIEYTNYNVIIVDNGSSDKEAKKIKERFNGIRVIELKRNLGFANANNVGIQIALREKPDYVLLLNNDTIVDQKFLNEMMNVAEKYPDAGILGPKMYFYDEKNKIWYAGGKLNMYFNHSHEGLNHDDSEKYEDVKKTDYVTGACMLIKKSVFEDIGLLPKEYFLGWEDIDFCTAARRKGYSCIFVPRSRIWHKGSASFNRHNLRYKQVFYGFRNRIIMRRKYLSKSGFALFIIIQFCVVIPVHLMYYLTIYRDNQRIKSMFIGIVAGIKDKKRIRYSPS